MAAPADDMITATRGMFYFPEATRESSAAMIAEAERPILRPSSQAGFYAFSFYDVAGTLKHGLVRPALVDDSGYVLAISVPELIEHIKAINPGRYVPTEPRPLGEDPSPPMEGGSRRRRRRSHRHRKSRRTVRRQRQ